MKIKVPFKFRFIYFEKELDFVFKIATLEWATEEILKCGLEDIKDKDPQQLNIVLFYSGYVIACQRKYKKPIYTLEHAEFWVTHLSKESQEQFRLACKPLFRKAMEGEGEKKK